MNLIVFALVAWIALGLESALPPVLDASASGVRPSFLIPLVVFVALHAETRAALWAALVLGLFVDLISPVAMVSGGSAVIPGPHALGFFLAAQVTLSLRGMVMRRNPITLVVLSAMGSIVSGIVVVAILTVRAMSDDSLAWRGAGELLPALLSGLYTAAAALVLSFPLFAAAPAFGFPNQHAPRFMRRE